MFIIVNSKGYPCFGRTDARFIAFFSYNSTWRTSDTPTSCAYNSAARYNVILPLDTNYRVKAYIDYLTVIRSQIQGFRRYSPKYNILFYSDVGT